MCGAFRWPGDAASAESRRLMGPSTVAWRLAPTRSCPIAVPGVAGWSPRPSGVLIARWGGRGRSYKQPTTSALCGLARSRFRRRSPRHLVSPRGLVTGDPAIDCPRQALTSWTLVGRQIEAVDGCGVSGHKWIEPVGDDRPDGPSIGDHVVSGAREDRQNGGGVRQGCCDLDVPFLPSPEADTATVEFLADARHPVIAVVGPVDLTDALTHERDGTSARISEL